MAGLTKHQGQSTHNYRYDAYGYLLPATGSFTAPHNHYTFIGKEWDEHLGLYEFGFRLYDPWAGVWLTREPLPGQAWAPRTWHRYQYAYASPISYYDPYGLQVPPPPKCDPGEICYTGTTGPYTLQSEPVLPFADEEKQAPTGATPSECIPLFALAEFEGSSEYHKAVQIYFITYIRPGAQMEVPIPGAGPFGGVGHADLVYGNEIWEVKPDQQWWHGPRSLAQLQLQRYIDHMPGATHGSYIPPFVVPYGDEQIVVRMYPGEPGILFYKVEGMPQPLPAPVPIPEEKRETEKPFQPALQPVPVEVTVGVSVAFLIWLGAKLLSPVCGPAAPICAVGF